MCVRRATTGQIADTNYCRRHDDSIVVFDRTSKQLVLQSADSEPANLEPECPYCHRPLRDDVDPSRESRRPRAPSAQPGFVNPEYFRMLSATLPSTPHRSEPSSPRRRLVHPAPTESVSPGSAYRSASPSTPGISAAALSEGYFQRFFVEEGVLGRGGKGVVLLVKHVLDGVPLGEYACKRVPVGDDHEWLRKVLIEVQLLQRLSHQNLVSYRHVWLENVKLSNFGPSVPCAFILQQYCNSGDLQKYVCGSVQQAVTPQQLKDRLRRKSRGQPDPPDMHGPIKLHFDQIYSFFKDITCGLNFLHQNGYIHRDLKPSNCLLHETGRELRVLVSDFGEVQSEDTLRTSTGSTGTVSYCAPEVLRRLSPEGPFGNFTFKSDVFSLGMILYFLCFAQLPYRNADAVDEDKEDLDQLRIEISQWAGFDDARRMRPELPEKLYSFLKRLLSVDPNQRPTAEEVLNGIQAGVSGTTDSRRFHRNGSSSQDMRSNSLSFPFEFLASTASEPRSPGLATRALSPRQPAGYGANKASESRHPSESTSEEAHHRRASEHNLFLRRSSLSPSRRNSVSSQTPLRVTNHLLLPPPPRFTLRRVLAHRTHEQHVTVALAFLKVLSATQPCSPLAVNPWLFYPLIALAAADLSTTRTWVHVLTLITHCAALSFAFRRGTLCLMAATNF